jgi:hypothetical protein
MNIQTWQAINIENVTLVVHWLVTTRQLTEKISDTKQPNKEEDFQSKLETLKFCYDQLKNDFGELKTAFENVNKKLEEKTDENKNVKKLNSEIIKLKQDYKNCIEAVKTETFARNKAETIAKVLKDILDAQNALKDCPMEVDSSSDENMETADTGEWIQSKMKRKNKLKNNLGKKNQTSAFNCDVCNSKFDTQSDLVEHMKIHVLKEPHQCSECKKSFEHPRQLKEHERMHTGADVNNCTFRGKTIGEQNKTEHQEKMHSVSE